jgi:hypothetical protein
MKKVFIGIDFSKLKFDAIPQRNYYSESDKYPLNMKIFLKYRGVAMLITN